jgi:TonB family protein
MTRIGPELAVLLILTSGTAGLANAASSQQPVPDTTGTALVVNPPRIDVKHLIHLGAEYYPKQSLKNHEQGTCYLSLYVAADGSIPAVQLVKSTGYPLLDIAYIEAVWRSAMLPGTVNGVPTAAWADLPLTWNIDKTGETRPPRLEKSAVPRIVEGYELQVGDKYYPEAARAKHEKGYCVVHAEVGSTGAVLNAVLTRSTGSPILDRACLAALKDARFNPELQDGQPVADSTDIAIYW